MNVNNSSSSTATSVSSSTRLIDDASDELQIVRFALAMHLDAEPFEIEEEHRLEEDLGLDPLDLVLVVLRLEELGDVELPVADLEGISTVGDLVEVVRIWCIEEPRSIRHSISTLLPPPPRARKESGMHLREDARISEEVDVRRA